MALQPGDRIPNARVAMMENGQPAPVSTTEFFSGRLVALFAVPGAFTPTCSARHLPGYVDQLEALHARGVDTVACLSVNDAYVMQAWSDNAGAEGIMMLADGNADFVQALGLETDSTDFFMGQRSRRFSLLARDSVVVSLFVEKSGDFLVSSAEYMLANARFND